MHPAHSIIVLTTLSGSGFGLMAWLGLGFGPSSMGFGFIACGLALILASIGLATSLWHLGNPQRAWRALSQWRTSWLSREGVLAVATLGVFGLYALFWIAGMGRSLFLGVLSAVLALATVFATSMVYASIKAVPRWSKTPTPVLFISYAIVGGALAFAALDLLLGNASTPVLAASILLLVIAAAIALWWRSYASGIGLDADGSTTETAIGLPNLGRARLFETPHTSPNYLMKEMVFRIGRKHAEKLHRLAFNGAFIFPILCLCIVFAVSSMAPLLVAALLVHLVGVAASRWLFFAEAQHVVSLYYGHR
jgi:DMSO reductase anchor subunit